MDKGLDTLREKAAQAYAQGARFAKWRNVLQIDPAQGLPSEQSVAEATTQLAKYAAICQQEGLCPIVEPVRHSDAAFALCFHCLRGEDTACALCFHCLRSKDTAFALCFHCVFRILYCLRGEDAACSACLRCLRG